ncbi:HK97-gp10 family putative phage morphogenesis protein [Pseudomonas sp. JS3066]|uniref:HK97-gp10 family putative phage morphogenesis protein n=1 Tax=Pseudomonas sp. JS3066 TaxID=3090665 RepID=UPI002E7BF03B|nr:HK97-gp10 family putative phage morphogenesis protein [Pseudomonas sp. JS3066]WVK91140.1 HK97-gp10 family putative phage morphogenesis protein [Pseudomonas sp. JS3066]
MADDWGQARLEGLTELKGTLRALTPRLEKRVVMGALRAAAQVIRRDALSRVPVLQTPHPYRKPGTVKKNITVRRSRRDRAGVYVGVKPMGNKQIRAFSAGARATGQRGTKKTPLSARNPDDPWYWIMLEFGTRNMPARPFLRPAFETKKYEALQKFEEYMKRRVVKEAEKLAREMGMKAA